MSLELRNTENIFYPLALRITPLSSSRADIPKALESGKPTSTDTTLVTLETSKEADRASTMGKEKEPTKDKVLEPMKALPAPKETSKDKGAA